MSECSCEFEPTPAGCPEHGVLEGVPPSGEQGILGSAGSEEVPASGEAPPSGDAPPSGKPKNDWPSTMKPGWEDRNRAAAKRLAEEAPPSGCPHGQNVSPAICKAFHGEGGLR